MKKIILYLLFSFTIFSCTKQEDNRCFKTIGSIITVNQTVANFDTLEVFGKIEYVIVQDSVNKVEITAGENIIEFITAESVNGKLTIHNKNMCNFIRSYEKNKIKVVIHFKNLNRLIYSGALSLTNQDTITQSYFRIDSWSGNGTIKLNINNYFLETFLHSGAADLYVNGKSEIRYIYSASSSFVYDKNYETKNYYINHSGTGNYYIGKCVNAEVQILNVGDIYYKGSPNFTDSTITGKGKLIKAND